MVTRPAGVISFPRPLLVDAVTLVVGVVVPPAILLHAPATFTVATLLLVLMWLGIPLHSGARLVAATRYAIAERAAYRLGADYARYIMHVAFNVEERQDVGRRS